ncbi:hypothetical protein C8R43DRAFT_1123690 [Mycena crocata]|nr:hypothetical protein C8R43DRAFT_1123690 [Mycena crocata]
MKVALLNFVQLAFVILGAMAQPINPDATGGPPTEIRPPKELEHFTSEMNTHPCKYYGESVSAWTMIKLFKPDAEKKEAEASRKRDNRKTARTLEPRKDVWFFRYLGPTAEEKEV